jgi:hypothetical protein
MIGYNRRRIFVKGLGNFEVRQTDPTVETAFSNVGFHESTEISDLFGSEDQMDETGILVDIPVQTRTVKGVTQLMQSSKDEIDLIRNATAKLYAVRFHGLAGTGFWQFFSFPESRINPSLPLGYAVGKRLLPLSWGTFNQQLAFPIPEYYLVERADVMDLSGLQIWVDARAQLNVNTTKILDVSGFERHGTVSADFATIWQLVSGVAFLRFDGTNDEVSFGDVLDDDAVTDFVIEKWFRVQGADATVQEIMAKKLDLTTNGAGFGLFRNGTNKFSFKISDGTANVTIASAANVLQNVWKKGAVTVDRNGNAQLYLNGVADGTPTSVAAILTAANAENLYLGRDGTNFGQTDGGGFRIHRYPSGLPSNIATILLNHFNAEKGYYGIA